MTLPRRLVPQIDTLQAFECAARHGSFTQAARELSLTQSAVSRKIKDLELQLGSLLFERVRQRVVLSDQGRKLLPDVVRLIGQAEDTMMRAMANSQADASLSLSVLPTFGARWLMPRLQNFLRVQPNLVVNIAARAQPFDFDEEPFDIAIHYGQPIWAKAVCIYLCSEIVVPVAAPGLSTVQNVTDSPFGDAWLLHLASRAKAWSEWFEAVGLAHPAPYAGHHFDQFSMLIEAAIAGMGVALLPRYLIETELASGRLIVVDDRPIKTENAYYLVVPDRKKENPLSKAFCAWALEQVGHHEGASDGS
ncbi:LysR family transcriptional regulator [Aquamicrobium soli]|jgi:LysR family glycine cleavage system transcriptional activator|uniref:LysR family transcriptional regulator n=1 Tax=Aquamicrobium soli TaxID=1811518 RepID=A0ABV7KDR5_9HYPH